MNAFDSLDRLAHEADTVTVTDRLDRVHAKARGIRRRRRTAAAVGTLAAAAVVGGLATHAVGSDRAVNPPVAQSPTTTPAPTPGATGTPPEFHQEIALDATGVGPRQLRIAYTITGHSAEYSGEAGAPSGQWIGFTRVLLDGVDLGGSDGGAIMCTPGGTVKDYAQPFGESAQPVEQLIMPISPGTHVVTVEAGFCTPTGHRATSRAQQTVTVGEPGADMTATASRTADVDGDGRPDTIEALVPGADVAGGTSAHNLVEVRLATGHVWTTDVGAGPVLRTLDTVQLDRGPLEIVAAADDGATIVLSHLPAKGLIEVLPASDQRLPSVDGDHIVRTGVVNGALLTVRSVDPLSAIQTDPNGQHRVDEQAWTLGVIGMLEPHPVGGDCLTGTDLTTLHPCH